ncbi:hypothetical protein [Streptomyces vinaceus]|uniref:hypothetical protein n=1 Tax=Streptomyces vinaceus TaxID=1960 RepID=UPI0036A70C52
MSEVLKPAAGGHAGPDLVPMTVTEPRFFAETVGLLRGVGHDVRHFALPAERQTVLRGLGLKRESFAVARLDGCLEALRGGEFAGRRSPTTSRCPGWLPGSRP